MSQRARWQHLVFFADAVLLLSGGMILAIAMFADAPLAPKWYVGAGMWAGALATGWGAWAMLKRDLAWEERGKRIALGMFELREGAAEKIIELNVAVSRHFGLWGRVEEDPVTSKPVARKEPMPATLGALAAAVNARRAEAERRPAQLGVARKAVAHAADVESEEVRWSAKVADVVPKGRGRFAAWERAREVVPSLPSAGLSKGVEMAATYTCLAVLVAIAVPIVQHLDANGSTRVDHPGPGLRAFGHMAGLVVFGVLIAGMMIPIRKFGRRRAARLPDQVVDIPSVADFVGRAPDDAWREDEVEEHVRELVGEAFGVDAGDWGPEESLLARRGSENGGKL